MSLSLNCLIHGEVPEKMFTVEVEKTKNVSILKDLIKEKKAPHLNHVAASDLDLWKVDLHLDKLGAELVHVDFNHFKLLPRLKLSSLFNNIVDDHDERLHIIAKVPVILPLSAPQLLSLNCFIHGDDPDRMFTVEVEKTKNVSILKKLLKEENPSSLGNIDVKNIDLWKVSFPIDDLILKTLTTPGPKLRPERLLSEVFSVNLDINCIHVVVRALDIGAPSPGSFPPPSAYKFPIPSTNQLVHDRQKFCCRRKSEAPSTGGNPQTFLDNQNKDDTCIPCNRPHGCPTALPATLLHPIFGEFLDDCNDHAPLPDDVKFFLDFVQVMANIYKAEGGRQQALLRVFNENKIHIKQTKIDTYTTDGDLSVAEFRFLIAELKNEVGAKAAEPLFQAILYYLEATRNHATKYPNSVLPCIIVLIFGPYIAFAGAAWTDRPVVQMLSPAISCHYHNTDLNMEGMLLRHLGALRRAIHSLEAYYSKEIGLPSLTRIPTHPYPTSFTSGDNSEEKHFKYLSKLKGRNLFFGEMHGDGGAAICIKFVPRYCKEAHELLAENGFAPKLHAVERLPGGLFMVVMDDVSEDYESLFNFVQEHPDSLVAEKGGARNLLSEKIRHRVLELHRAGFVHGDIRDTNIMIKKSGFNDGSFMMVDYDSSGVIKQVRYPLDLNTTTVKRPQGATGGAIVEVEHDLEMLDTIWDP